MILVFSEEEKEWIEMEPFNWHVKEGCPEKIKVAIERKLNVQKKFEEKMKELRH